MKKKKKVWAPLKRDFLQMLKLWRLESYRIFFFSGLSYGYSEKRNHKIMYSYGTFCNKFNREDIEGCILAVAATKLDRNKAD